jgi:hypothetical protein
LHLFPHGARHDIARREFRVRMHTGHEAAAIAIDQPGACTAECFRDERQWVVIAQERRRMELHELEVVASCTGSDRHGKTIATRRARVAGVPVELTEPARGNHRVVRADRERLRLFVASDDSGNCVFIANERDRNEAGSEFDVGRGAGSMDQRRNQCVAGAVAVDVQHTGSSVSGFAMQGDVFAISVEAHTLTFQPSNGAGPFAAQELHAGHDAKACACR